MSWQARQSQKRIAALVAEGKAICHRAEAENRGFTPAERDRLDEIQDTGEKEQQKMLDGYCLSLV